MRNIRIEHWAFYVLSCFPLIGMKATVWAIILFALTAFIKGTYASSSKAHLATLAMTISLFVLIAFRCLFPEANKESLSYLEVSVSLVALPLAFYLLSSAFSQKELQVGGWLFIGSSLLAFGLGMGYALFQVAHMQLESQEVLSYHIRTIFEDAVDYHPTYASTVLGMVILKLLHKILNREGHPLAAWLLMGVAMLILALLASRTPIAATLLCMTVLVGMQTKSVFKTAITAISILALAFISFQTIPSFSSRFKEVSVSNTQLPEKKNEDSFNLRTGILRCSMEMISSHWIWGIGPGQVKARLNTCYDSIAPEVYKDKNFNTHNQFMDYWAGLGLLGPLLLLALMASVTIILWKKADWVGVCTAILFLLAMQTENLLTRQNGIVAFCFFLGLHTFASSNPLSIRQPTQGPDHAD